MSETSISVWSRIARIVGIVWLIAAIAAAVADYQLTTDDPPDRQAMFGGHFIAFAMMLIGWIVAGLVLLLVVAALIHARRSPKRTPGWGAIALAITCVVIGNAAVFMAFIR